MILGLICPFICFYRVNFLTWLSSPASLLSLVLHHGCRVSWFSTGRTAVPPSCSLSTSGQKWRRRQEQFPVLLPSMPYVPSSPLETGITLNAWCALWSHSWCVCVPGICMERSGVVMPSTPSPTSTSRTARPYGDSTGTPTLAPEASPTRAASWSTIVTSCRRLASTAKPTCTTKSSQRRSKCSALSHSSRRIANSEAINQNSTGLHTEEFTNDICLKIYLKEQVIISKSSVVWEGNFNCSCSKNGPASPSWACWLWSMLCMPHEMPFKKKGKS